jgi:hypothetical protein
VSEIVSKWEGMTAFREALERLRTEN